MWDYFCIQIILRRNHHLKLLLYNVGLMIDARKKARKSSVALFLLSRRFQWSMIDWEESNCYIAVTYLCCYTRCEAFSMPHAVAWCLRRDSLADWIAKFLAWNYSTATSNTSKVDFTLKQCWHYNYRLHCSSGNSTSSRILASCTWH